MANNRFMKSSNPFIGDQQFARTANKGVELGVSRADGVMTVQGAINKTIVLSLILVATALVTVAGVAAGMITISMPLVIGVALAAFGVAMVTMFKPTIAPYTAPLYAVLEGGVVGIFSLVIAMQVGNVGIVFNAILLTALCLVSMLFLYKTGIIKVTQKFRSIVTTAIGAIAMLYLVSIGLSFAGINIPYLHEGGFIGVGISLVIIGVANMSLLLDFDNIERGAQMGAPKFMEWVSALGLLITLVWLYLEILRLLSVFSGD